MVRDIIFYYLEERLLILGIETSCDETSAAVVKDYRTVLSNIIHTQIPIHLEYGGVVPEIASRNHLIKISSVVDEALEKAGVSLKEIDAIAVTKGPGLVGAVLVGLNYAKALAYALKKPLIGVNHLIAHLLSPLLSYKQLEAPFMSLVVSGGHTYLAFCKDYNDIKIIGSTRDDAIGEAYDKVARTLGFEYPGGPKIDSAAKKGDKTKIIFPRTYLEKNTYDFSFSGIKSAVLNYIHKQDLQGEPVDKNDVAACFQEAVLEVLISKSISACRNYNINKLVVSGGVAANSRLRELMNTNCEKLGISCYYPEFEYCTDNAAMIAAAAFYLKNNDENPLTMNANPSMGLGE